MKLHGFCTRCRRVKLINVSAHALALASARGGAVHGVCDSCQEKQ